MLRTRQRAILGTILCCFVLVFVFGAVASPRPAQAQLGGAVVETGPLTAVTAQREVRLNIGQAIVASAVVGLINAVTLFGQQIAYDLAVGLASGCRGQNACAFRDSFGTYLTSKLYSAAGEFVATLAEPWAELGFDLCNPRLPDIALSIQLGLISEIQPPTPRCDFAKTINNWQNLVREVQDPNALLQHVSFGFDPAQTDFGQALIAHEQFRIKIAREQEAATKEREEGGGVKAQISPISGNITTPSVVMRRNFERLTEQGEDQTIGAGDIVGATLGSGQVWAAVGTTVLGTFTNTLISRMLKAAIQGIFGPGRPFEVPDLRSLIGSASRSLTAEGAAGLSGSAVGLLSAGASVRTPSGTFSYLTDLAVCPEEPGLASQFNCTVDDKFMLALQRAATGEALTVAQAMSREIGLLDPAKPFGFINPEQGIEPDFRAGYSYSAMKKLRLLRVLPVGWELAALKIRDELGQPFTLKDVVDGWNAVGPDGKCGTRDDGTSDDTSPFCGLTDPSWVLKAPGAVCKATTFGERLDASGTGRQEVCADLQHCVAADQDGNCRASGYCTREKNFWKLPGETCGEQYASCETFQKQGNAPSRAQEFSLLENTVNFGVCNTDNAGCAGYLTNQRRGTDGQLTWFTPASRFADLPRLYLDRDAPVCDSAAAGCTEFMVPTSEINAILDDEVGEGAGRQPDQYPAEAAKAYWRVPPDYLGCTGEENDAAECASYARLCRREEVGCERYSPARGGDFIPAITSALDECPPACVGYDTYLKQSSRFEPTFTASELGALWPAGAPQEQMYLIIPARTAPCREPEAGCEEFTNLRTEERQYFTDLRACQTPGADSKTYFTWEGSDESGYQLKSWPLKASNLAYQASRPELRIDYNRGSATPPCTNYAVSIDPASQETTVTCADTDENQARCDPLSADLTLAQRADCRAFYDEQGNIFHRFLSATIISTPQCQAFRWSGFPGGALPEVPALSHELDSARRSRLEQVACVKSHGFWNEQNSQCIYLGAPALSQACRAQASGCRGFKGDASGNVHVLLVDTFPAGDNITERWSVTGGGSIALSAEALRVGDKSLRVLDFAPAATLSRALDNHELEAGASYFVSVVAKGPLGAPVEVFLDQASFGTVRLTPDWQYLELGPLAPAAAAQTLKFKNTGSAAIIFFLDEVRLRASPEPLYLVKNTWDIPEVCDRLPEAAGGAPLPGAMLGCETYTDRAGAAQHLRSFSRLCRNVSVGCTDLIDTRNSVSPFAQTWNTESEAPSTNDDVVVLADRHRFVVVNPQERSEIACQAEQKGCQALGLRAGQSEAVYLRNDPARYSTDLCRAEAAGCAIWKRDNGSEAYFKDPEIAGAGFCSWKDQVRIGATLYNGWFRQTRQRVLTTASTAGAVDSPEKCAGFGNWNADSESCIAPNGDTLCSQAAGTRLAGWPCRESYCVSGAGGQWDAQAVNADGSRGACVSETPCYGAVKVGVPTVLPGFPVPLISTPTLFIDPASAPYLSSGTSFGIWRNADTAYAGRAGICPKEEATCTEFVDPTDVSPEHPDGQPYYRKDNAQLASARRDCGGRVSRQQGCVLFNNTEKPQQLWTAAPSYARSESQGGAVVDPLSDAATNNTNAILKVTRDRECAEWLQCRSAKLVYSAADSKLKSVCSILGRCAEVPLSVRKGGERVAECGKWILEPEPSGGRSGGRLTYDAYLDRDRTFFVREYVGYSLPNLYPLEKLREVNLGTFEAPDWRLAAVPGSASLTPGGIPLTDEVSGEPCSATQPCSEGRACSRRGRCASQESRPACRGFPERSSPLPNLDSVRGFTIFANSPVCEGERAAVASDWSVAQCGCNYQKDEYGVGLTRYFGAEQEDIPAGICQSGAREGQSCSQSGDCPEGTCARSTRLTQALGWQGFCLEEDTSPQAVLYGVDPTRFPEQRRSCLTWWPVDVLQSTPDIYNQFAEAGYQIPEFGGQYWCLESGAPQEVTVLEREVLDVNSNDDEDDITIRLFDVSRAGIRKSDIKGIKILMEPFIVRSTVGTPEEPMSGIGAVAGFHYIEPGQAQQDEPSQTDRVGEHLGNFTHQAFETPTASNHPFYNQWWWGGDDDAQHSDEEGRGNVTEEGVPTLAQLRGTVQQLAQQHQLTKDGLIQNVNCGPGWDIDEKYDGQALLFEFDPETQVLRSITAGFCNGDDGGSAYEFTDESPNILADRVRISVKVVLHGQCDVVTRVDPRRSAPFTDRLWKAGTEEHVVDHAGLDYTRATGLTPFGSSSSHTAPPTSDKSVSMPWFLNWNRLELDPALAGRAQFAGWPYACGVNSDIIPGPLLPFAPAGGFRNVPNPRHCVNPTGLFNSGNCDVDYRVRVRRGLFEDTEEVFVLQPHIPADALAVRARERFDFYRQARQGAVDPRDPSGFESRQEFLVNTTGLCEFLGGTCSARHFGLCSVNTAIAEITAGPVAPLTETDAQRAQDVIGGDTRDNFSELFARSFRNYTWTPTADAPYRASRGRYTIGKENLRWDVRGNFQALPQVADVRVSGTAGEGPVIGRNGFLPITLEFFAWANDNHMPLRNLTVDWDDGTTTSTNGLYRNHRARCGGPGFGSQSGVSCEEEPFQYSIVYFCERGQGPNWSAGSACPDPALRAQFGGCCVFRPAVQVRDNWGYCNLFGPEAAITSVRRDEACNVSWNSKALTPAADHPWAPLNSRILVAPE